METESEWLARIGSAEALEARTALRVAGKINAPIKGVHGLAAIVGRRTGAADKHSLFCKCDTCIPPEVREWMDARAGKPVQPLLPEQLPDPPKKARKKKSDQGFPKPRNRWDSSNRGRSSN